ncbi:MAG: hypothetical protein M1819_007259 [Sarea resinae]|nr:MAG: hypothetical protein M1819_007259 [Sarea resinae]
MENRKGSSSAEYWKRYLAGAESCYFAQTLSNTDAAKERQTYQFDLEEHCEKLHDFCANQNVALPALFQTAWAAILGRFTASSDICFHQINFDRGTPKARICRADLAEGVSAAQVLHSFDDEASHQISINDSFSDIYRYVGREGSPLSDTLMQFEMGRDVGMGTDPISGDTAGLERDKIIIAININTLQERVEVTFGFLSSVLAEVQAVNLASTFDKCVSEIIQNSSTSISDLDLFSKHDEEQVFAWNADYPESYTSCMHNLVEERVRTQPDAPALVSWDGSLTYVQLDHLASSLAGHLHLLGVREEVLVPFCFDKSRWAVVTMLAILKAGGACVALNPMHPISRLEGIIRKVDASVVVVGQQYEDMLKGHVPHIVKVNPTLFETIQARPIHFDAKLRPSNPTSPSFVVFTSGSTGEPKGIVLEHQALCTSARAHGAAMRLSQQSRVLQFAAYTFDVSIGEIFSTLMHGGCIIIPSEQERMNDLAGVISRLRVNWAYLTPTVASLLNPADVPGLETLSLGGEAVTEDSVRRWADQVYLINIYGPAETTIWSTGLAQLSADTPPSNIGVGLGALMWVTEISNPQRLCPIGGIGELLIEGPILARGYLKDSAKTDAAFIEDPAWLPRNSKSRRLYRTGDLVRYNPDRTLSFIGRRDTQVKMFGQRIEMGEIETHVNRHSQAVKTAAVEMIRLKSLNDKPVLAAFLAFETRRVATSDKLILPLSNELLSVLRSLQDRLTESLPSYMVPSLYIPLAFMPTSTSGKLDRLTLRSLAGSFRKEELSSYFLGDAQKRHPETLAEKRLQTLWAEALNVTADFIGADDNFFRLGGDSIRAMKLVTFARKSGLSLAVTDIFRHPKLSDMALFGQAVTNGIEPDIEPFSLLQNTNIESLLREITESCGIEADRVEDAYQCTPLQEGLMAITMKEPSAYVFRNVYRIPKNVDLDRFRAAWDLVFQEAELMRTTIIHTDKLGSCQVVLRHQINWKLTSSLEDYILADRQDRMEYGKMLTRFAIIESGINEPHFVWTAHHSTVDGFSIPLILERVEKAYAKSLVEPAPPFKRVIKYLSDGDVEASKASKAYWRSQLSGSAPPKFPQLPSAAYQPLVNETIEHKISFSRTDKSDITTSTLIRAAWAILLSKYSHTEDDVVFGVTLTGRNAPLPGITETLGPTICTVPLRVGLDDTVPVSDLLRKIQDQATDMIPFEHTGLQNIRSISADSKRACNFQNLLVVQPADALHRSSIGLETVDVPALGLHTYAMIMQCLLSEGGIKFLADFDNSVVSTKQMQHIMYQLEHLVNQLSSSSDVFVGAINMLSSFDRAQILSWNSMTPEVVEDCIPGIFKQQVLAQPDAQAVCAWDGDLSYAQLDELSDQLAWHLVELGVGPEMLVPLCFDKSLYNVVAMVAVLKAGGACVALDPTHPPDRLQGIIQDTESTILVAAPQHGHLFEHLVNAVVLAGPSLFEQLPIRQGSLPSRAKPDNPAVVLFTSGSTGKPKGIVLEHASYCTSSRAHGSAWGIGPGTRVFQFAAHTFDVSVGDFLTTIMRGACVCIPSELDRLNNVAGVINKMNVNYTFMTPTVANLLDPRDVPGLKRLVLGGEAATNGNIRTWADHLDLIICYGPAECSIYCSGNPPATQSSLPSNLGRPIGAILWVAEPSDHNKLAPIGCVGELLVQGRTVARGYLKDPEKTEAAFIQDPPWLGKYCAEKHRRLYKTGDLVRYNMDGTLSYVARKDTQVKVHGQRVELGEIEYHLSASPEIRHSLLSVPTQGQCQGRLVVVLSLQDLSSPTDDRNTVNVISGPQKLVASKAIATVRSRLSEKLPPYMIPAVWVVVEKIPLNASGKMFRRVVKTWLEEMTEETYRSVAELAEGGTFTAPKTETEKTIQSAFCQILNLSRDQISIDSSFLSLGGDSISAMQLMSRCRTQNVRISVQDILRLRTVEKLALHATSQAPQNNPDSNEVTDVTGAEFGLSPIQQMFFDLAPAGENQFNQSFLLQLTRWVQPESLTPALDRIISYHPMLRARFRESPNGWAQFVTDTVSGAYDFDVNTVCDRKEMMNIVRTRQTGLNIEKGPLVAGNLFNLNGTQVLFLTVHHLVVDLVSWRIILHDLEEILTSGEMSSEKSMTFQTWNRLQSGFITEQVAPTDILPFTPPAADFGYWNMTDHSNLFGETRQSTFKISPRLTSQLLQDCHTAFGTEPLDVMLAALMLSFKQTFADRSSPAVFLEGHGREPWNDDIDLSRTVGWFTTMYPVHVESASADVVDMVQYTKDTRRRIPGNGLPYFSSRYLNLEVAGIASENKDIEILFNYLGLYQQLERKGALLRQFDNNTPELNEISPKMQRYSLFEIEAGLDSGCMQFSFAYNINMQRQADIRLWVKAFEISLTSAVERLVQTSTKATLTDFPLLPLDYDGLKILLNQTLPQMGITSPDEVEDIYPCSPMQLGLLLGQMKSSGAYQFWTTFEIIGDNEVTPEKIGKAWQHVVDRHASLRTIFAESATRDGVFDQIVLKQMQAETVYLESNDVLEKLGEELPITATGARSPHRLTVCRTSAGQTFCKLEINHALIDGTSMALIFRDLKRAYDGNIHEGPRPLYSDYISHLQQQPLQSGLDYWKSYLQGMEPCHFPLLDDGIDQPKELKSVPVELEVSRESILEFTNRYDLTLANLMQTAWGLVLRSFTGFDHVCFGYLASGRDAPVKGVQDAVGPFINMLICRLDMTETTPLSKVLRKMREDFIDSLPHQYCSLAEIQHAMGLSGERLFSTAMSFQRYSPEEPSTITLNTINDFDPTEFDLTVNIGSFERELVIDLTYWTSKIADGQAKNIANQISAAIAQIVSEPEHTVGQVELFSKHNERQLQVWNSHVPEEVDRCMHEVIKEHALRNPLALAICSWDGEFTYEDLHILSMRLSFKLREMGVMSEVFVPLCFERSAWTIIAMVAVLKAGGAFVLLDPSQPDGRLEFIIAEVGAKFALASPTTEERLRKVISPIIVVSPATIDEMPTDTSLEDCEVTPQNTMYSIFTSGSTGKPKGVLMEHGPCCSSVAYHGAAMGFSPTSRMFQFGSYTFDATILEVFTTYYWGGCVCVPTDEERMSNIAGAIQRTRANITFFTPTVVRLLNPDEIPTLRTLLLGGEALGQDNLDAWANRVHLISGYGPTECCVFCVYTPMSGTRYRAEVIGRAIGSLLWVVNPTDHHRLTPIGSVGELVIQGPLLGRGYLNDKNKTDISFITSPAWLESYPGVSHSVRLYKTGDLVRYNSNGTLSFVGRKDTQVKVNGQRIELGEIEHHIKAHLSEAIHIAVDAIAPTTDSQRQILTAFLSFKDESRSEIKASLASEMTPELRTRLISLQAKLSELLPSYMVPQMYLPLQHMPLSSAGKTDRGTLRSFASKLPDSELAVYSLADDVKRQPSTEMEIKLQALWMQVLKTASVGADDNFFRVGGDSISAMRLASNSRKVGISLGVSEIFRYPHLRDMAVIAERVSDVSDASDHDVPLEAFALVGTNHKTEHILREISTNYGIPSDSIQDIYPCTPLQEGLMAITMKEPEAYIYRAAFKLPLSLDIDRFKLAWATVVQMNPVLRTVIVPAENLQSVQVVVKDNIEWQEAESLDEYFCQDRRTPIGYGSALTRYGLTKDRHFVWTLSHVCYDGWSFLLLLDQVQRIYKGVSLDTGPPFARYIQYIGQTDPIKSDGFWRSQLDGAVPTQFPQILSGTYQPHVDDAFDYKFAFANRITTSATTTPVIVSAAWALVIAQFSGNTDVIFGMTHTGRNASLPGITEVIGPTIATVPMRIDIDLKVTVAEFLQSVQDKATAMIPFEHAGLQHISRLGPSCQEACNFQNIFVVQPVSMAGDEILGMERIEIPQKGLHTYALTVECYLGDKDMTLNFEFDSHVISKDKIQQLAYQVEHIVKQLSSASMSKSLNEIDFFSPQDSLKVSEWNRQLPEAAYECVHTIIERQARLRPDSPAVYTSEGTSFTYFELDRLATRLAGHLVSLGIGPEVIVPLCFEKSPWTIISMLAVIKAGGAFVALDPEYPVNRLQFIIDSVSAKTVLVSSRNARIFAEPTLEQYLENVIAIDRIFIESLPAIKEQIQALVVPENPMYLIFTSGSTGKPKGVVIEHIAAATSMVHHGSQIGFNPRTRMFQFSSYTFDASIFDIFTTMCNGGCVCIPSEEQRSGDMAKAMRELNVNSTFLTPTMARLLRPDDVPALKLIILGGEAVGQDNVETWASRVRLVSGYGPTECSMCCQWALLTPGCDPVLIGRAVGCLAWIVMTEDHNKLAPVGSVGELVVQGSLLARGYLKDDQRTAEVFIENPPWLKGSSSKLRRIYKTGDLVKYNPDGTMNFIGRKDTQIKLHGQRIELAEIDHHLWAREEIRHATVIFSSTGHCKQRLTAVMSLRQIPDSRTENDDLMLVSGIWREVAGLRISAIQEQLLDRLPAYMVPTVWIVLESLPLSSSGKTDSGAVKRWVEQLDANTYHEALAMGFSSGDEKPRTATEEQLQGIIGRVLNLRADDCGVNRSFVSLGGDSITAMQVMSRCHSDGIAVTLRDILRSKTISQLALHTKSAKKVTFSVDKDEMIDTPFGLSPIQKMFMKEWSRTTKDATETEPLIHFNQSFFLRLDRSVPVANLGRALEAIVKRHSMLRARFEQTIDGDWVQRVTLEVAQSYQIGVHATSSEEVEMAEIIAQRQQSLNIFRGPIFAADIFIEENQEPELFLVAHHLFVDLVSWRIILEDLEQLLKSETLTMETPLPFQTWTVLQRDYTQKQLSPASCLPFDVVPANLSFWGVENQSNTYGATEKKVFNVDKSRTAQLLNGCHDALRTETMDVLLAVLVHSFSKAFKDRPLPNIFTEGHGREPWDNSIDVSKTVGWFTTIYPVTSSSYPEEDIIDILRRTKDTRRSIVGNGWPYFASSQLNSEGIKAFEDHFPAEVIFNYFGRYQQLERDDALLKPSLRDLPKVASDLGKNIARFGLIEVSVEIVQGKMQFAFLYSQHLKHQDAIGRWIELCQSGVEGILTRLASKQPEYTLSDFPLLSMTYGEFDTMLHNKLPEMGISNINSIEDIYPCSPVQQGLLLAQTKEAGSYEMSVIHGLIPRKSAKHINVNRLEEAWYMIVSRHSALRTLFIQGLSGGDLFHQLVLKDIKTSVVRISSEIGSAVDALRQIPPMSDNGIQPPHRLVICQTPDGRVFTRIDMNHAIFDAHSMSVLFQEISLAYDASLHTSPSLLYSDYISYIRDQPADTALKYWLQYLKGVEPCHFPQLNESHEPRTLHSIETNLHVVSRLHDFCRARGVTVSNVLQTVWSLILRSYTGNDHVCFGYLASGRDARIDGIHQAIGPFLNMLISRADITESSKLGQIVEIAQEDFINGLPHQYSSLAEIQHRLGLSGVPLFNTTMSLQTDMSDNAEQPAISFEMIEGHDPTEYDITVNIGVSNDKVKVVFTFWSSTMSERQAASVADLFCASLNCLLDGPDRPLNELELFSKLDRAQIQTWNSRRPEASMDCVHLIFQRTAQRQPNAPAISAHDGSFTYQKLDVLSTQLAHYLKDLGVGPEVLVPFCFEKSAWTIVSILGVLKAGGAAVALDPSHPKDRLRTVVNDSEASVVLASARNANLIRDLAEIVVTIEESLFTNIATVIDPIHNRATPENAAFVVFTSGSTGKPKGIVLEHKGVCTMAIENAPVVGIDRNSRVLQYATYTFDVSIAETYITLMHGGCLCVPSEEQRLNDITGAINSMGVNWTFLTPSVAALLHPREVPTLKALTLGGEAITRELLSEWAGKVRMINSYGPAECSIWTSNNRLLPTHSPANIGCGNKAVLWITEAHNHHRLVPVGCVGELVVQGPILARGYLKDELKTRDAYIESPAWLRHFDSALANRFYKTGDLVRYCPDGSLDFVGRKDTQVKLRGQRVEMGEIEHQIKTRVSDNTQVVVEMITPAGQKSRALLATFLYLGGDTSDPFEEHNAGSAELFDELSESFRSETALLEDSLASSLPIYMIPSLYIPLRRVPKTTSMKTDRKQLRLSAGEMTTEQLAVYSLLSQTKRAPTTAVEKTLQFHWADVLKLNASSIGADDSFFRLGGDSISAMRLVSLSRKDGFLLTIANIFQHPKLSEMALDLAPTAIEPDYEAVPEPFTLLEDPSAKESILKTAIQVNIKADQIQDIYPCTPLQEGLMALTMRDQAHYFLQAAFKMPLALDLERFCRAWESLVETTDILRTRVIHNDDHGSCQLVLRPNQSSINWTFEGNLENYLAKDKNITVQYGGPLARYAILGYRAEDRYFVWSGHHALYDGFSISLMLERLQKLYYGLDVQNSPPFNRFIKYIQGTDQKAMNSYWRTCFSGHSALDFPAMPSQGYQPHPSTMMSHTISLDRSPNSDVTTPTMIRAAWAIVVSQYTNTTDISFGMTQTGRNAPVPGITEMVGPTITTVPVRVALDGNQAIAEYLRQVQDEAVQSIQFEHAGLQHIKSLNRECRDACNFKNLLVIQPREPRDQKKDEPLGLQRLPVSEIDFSAFGLVIECTTNDNSVDIQVGYDPKILVEGQMRNILGLFEHVLQLLGKESAEQKIASLDLFGAFDKQQLREWNKNPSERYTGCAHDVIHQQTASRPDALAINAWDGLLTYSELDDLSTRLSHHLVSLGIGPEVIVPLCFEKSAWAIVAELGVIKTGGAFVFLDPSHPQARLLEITSQVKAKLVITSVQQQALWPAETTTLPIDREYLNHLPSHEKVPVTDVTPRNVLYVVFTSGSTGKPKGCVVEHSSFLSGALHHARLTNIGPTSRVLQVAPYNFDVSILEILTALMSGACVCVPSEEDKSQGLAGIINDMRITWTFSTPSMVKTIRPEEVPHLKTLTLGGEALQKSDVETWAGELQLVNGYGPSECSIAAAGNTQVTPTTDPANIGRAVGGTCWVVDANDHNRLVPIGAIGELLIEGPIVARGYLYEPEKTAAVFFEEPSWLRSFWDRSDYKEPKRFYKTGDLVRYNPDGTIHFIGRKDMQVKLRGQRLELGEIEHHISLIKFVGHRIVALPSKGWIGNRLVAVLTLEGLGRSEAANDDLQPIAEAVRDIAIEKLTHVRTHLAEHLPPYMVPTVWIVLEEIPLLASGKINRTKLKAWLETMDEKTYRRAALDDEDVENGSISVIEPADTTAYRLSEKLAELLGGKDKEHVEALCGKNVVLTRAGLNSINVISLSGFIKKNFGITVPIERFMDSSTTVRDIAQYLESSDHHNQASPSSVDLLGELDILKEKLIRKESHKTNGASHPNGVSFSKAQPHTIFVTGGTGFLGSQILRELFTRPGVEYVIALVRAQNRDQAYERIISSAQMGRWWQSEFSQRLEVWVGDLAESRLGLGEAEWSRLSGSGGPESRIDAIIHNGAVVHWGADYTTLKAANVLGTFELLTSLSCASVSAPRLTYISGGEVRMDSVNDKETAIQLTNSNGYAQTKFLSEMLIKDYAGRHPGSHISIVKPGLVVGTAAEGISNTDDFLWRVVSSAIDIGAYSADDENCWIMVAGADQVARVIVEVSLNAERPPVETNLMDGMPVSELWEMLQKEFHYDLRPLKREMWLEAIRADVEEKGDKHRMWPVLHFLEASGGRLGGEIPESQVARVNREGIRRSVRKSIEYLESVGYMGSKDGGSARGNNDTVFGRSGVTRARA